MKYLIILIAVTSIGFSGKSQVRTTDINGKTCYVYPYQQEIEYSKRLFRQGVKMEEELQRDSLNREVISSEINVIETPVPFDKNLKKSKKLLLRLRSEYPGVLMKYDLPLEKDITPTLEPLPDGLYVQYYRDLPYVDKENVLRYRNDVVAGLFHLKDNKLHGYACWMNAMGDTIKAGNFVNGLKEGEWFFNEYEIERFDNPYSKKPLIFEEFVKGTYTDTSFLKITYKNGLKEGPTSEGYNHFVRRTGHYHNNETSGEWFEYGYTRKLVNKVYIYSDTPSVRTHYFIPEKMSNGQKPVSKSIIIRGRIIDRGRFDYSPETIILSNLGSFGEFYSLYIPENNTESDEGLELPEEKINSYPGEEYEEGMYNDYYVLDYESLESIDFEYDSPNRRYTFNSKEYSRNQLIDSLGYIANVANLYEEYYSNGQLKLRFRIVDGKIIEPDTVFWENGNPANVLTYNPVTKTYKEEVFDANRKALYVNDYDSTGTLTTQIDEFVPRDLHVINGKNYWKSDYTEFYELRGEDSLFHPISTKQTLYESLWPFDSTLAVSNTFDPATRVLENKHYALNKDLVYYLNCEFGEGYEHVNATEVCQSGKLMTKTIISGSYETGYRRFYFQDLEDDSLLTKRVYDWKDNYELTSDFTLYYDNQPFSGKFSMTANAPDFNLSVSKDAIHLEYSTSDKHKKALKKAFNAYEKRRKVRKEARFMTMSTLYRGEISSLVFNVLPFGSELFTPANDRFFRDFSSINYGKRNVKVKTLSEKDAEAFDKTVEGQFLDGKPSGTWTTRDQFGNPTTIMHFKNGELDGAVEHYRTVYPPDKNAFDYYQNMHEENVLLRERYPEKTTHYVAKVYHYKNGVLNGPMYEITWYGDTTVKANFVDGRQDGDALYRFKIGYTIANFESGAPDGIVRTYLTIPGRDTTLLFDLNYQNGLLQGESKSYHLNGKLAKHGFFLTGQPIDDFEAFDTLGFQYQYVKFQYNQPIEEKIWEENQLSVRYEFDWRDSIEFNANSITETSSLEHLLYQMGAGEGARYRPYYGRPSSVDKTGINYTMTKYYPNDTIARHGSITAGKKTGCWEFFSYEGRKLYEVEYYDSIMRINDSVRFKSKGILTLLDAAGQPVCRSYIVEKVEKYDCSHTDHHEIRMLYTFWERDSSQHRINGYVKNYYDNGVLMNEGNMKDGLATGVWKFYDPYGNLNMVGEYILGKRNGRWLSGDLSQVKYMGDICLNPNLPNLEEIMSYQEKLLDISVIYYQMTKVIKREYYGVNMNPDGPPEGYEGETEFEGEYYDDIEYYDR